MDTLEKKREERNKNTQLVKLILITTGASLTMYGVGFVRGYDKGHIRGMADGYHTGAMNVAEAVKRLRTEMR